MRMTVSQTKKKYPNTWLGLNDVEFVEGQIISVEVKYIDKSKSELAIMSMSGSGVRPFYTTPDQAFQLGVLG